MNLPNKSAIIAAIFFAAQSGARADINPDDLSGQYQCGGGTYTGAVTIWKFGDAYQLHWSFSAGAHAGIGLRDGDVLASTYTGGGDAGVVVYRIGKDKLVGKYTAAAANGRLFAETLTYTGPLADAGPAQPARIFADGARVAAKWGDTAFYLATVRGRDGAKYNVDYDDGDRGAVSGADMIPVASPEKIVAGSHVLACWGGPRMYPGVVAAINGGLCTVKWDDGDTPLDVPKEKIALLP
jgi:hypothetical protein